MTIADLIHSVMDKLRNQFYGALPARDFMRDLRYLEAAIATYGHECKQRGWHFDTAFIYRELCDLLQQFKRSGVEPQWMPIYLQNAIRRHIGVRSEELQAAARSVPKAAGRVVAGVQPVVVIEKSDTEVLATLYADVRKLRRQGRAARAPKAPRQGELI